VTPDYTTVIGVDAWHLKQLAWTWPTWRRHKPSLLKQPMIVFYDWRQIVPCQVRGVVDHPDFKMVPWPPEGVAYSGDGTEKWTNPQRHKMFAGFVHTAARHVKTPYWLKIDTDVVATGQDDWIDPEWFKDGPAIVSHPWSFTRPPEQMLELDKWVQDNPVELRILGETAPPLGLTPEPGSDRVYHKRIISFVGFFSTFFTRVCAGLAESTCGPSQIPVPSQDGYTYYVAKRGGLSVVRTSMKERGWQQWHTFGNIRRYAEEALR